VKRLDGCLLGLVGTLLVVPGLAGCGVEVPAPAAELTTTTASGAAVTTAANVDAGEAHVYSGAHPLGVGYGISSGAGLLFSVPDGGTSPEVAWSEDGVDWMTAPLSGVGGFQLDVLVGDPDADMPFRYVSSSDGVWWYDGSSFVPLESDGGPGRFLGVGDKVFLMSFSESGPSLSVVDESAVEALPPVPEGVRWVSSDGIRLVGHSEFMDGEPARLWSSDDGSEWELLAEVASSDLGVLAPEYIRVDSYRGVLVAEAFIGDESRYYVDEAGDWRELDVPTYPGFPLGLSSAGDGWMLMGVVDDQAPDAGMKTVIHVSDDLETWTEVDLSSLGIDPEPGGTGAGSAGFLNPGEGTFGFYVAEQAGQLDVWLFPMPGT
jgi:hypothetical protein